jgi:hypothetical protein
VQVTLKDPPACWLLLAVDLAAAVATAGSGGSGGGSSSSQPSAYSHLKGLQLCSTLTVRGVFTSDIRFGLQVGHDSAWQHVPAVYIGDRAAACDWQRNQWQSTQHQ